MHFRPLIDETTKKLFGEENIFLVTNDPSKGSHYHSSLTAISSNRGARVAKAFYERKGHNVLYRVRVKWKFYPTDDVAEYVRTKTLTTTESGVDHPYRQEGYRFWGKPDEDPIYVKEIGSEIRHNAKSVQLVEAA
ncbi:hypothetical protein PP935_gp167 [Rhizobium phage RHph_N34]|uniref:Uncharacterized protein n=1 Tax=Rhizobium phage RHph_N34 TaxID=2509586 RepID=A0A7S5RAI6_9CAUD|nr:hypothetical protein PP935_gp167 [Rhizobium phage RHph_N34]QIG73942.1 hypothetical protein EVC06_167 [Rhizobium phage RHph_N34]